MDKTSKLTLKLLVDTKNKKVLFAEAGKDFVDFLFTLLALPLGTVTSLLETNSHCMVGCFGDLYDSVQNLSQTYIQEGKNKDSVLKPTFNTGGSPLLLPNADSLAPKFYRCSNSDIYGGCGHSYVATSTKAKCPSCNRTMSVPITCVPVGANTTQNSVGGGLVKGVVTYMVMDNLDVSPMSTISSISLLNKFNIQELGSLEERVVDFGFSEGLNLLKASLTTKAVLTSVFLGKKAK